MAVGTGPSTGTLDDPRALARLISRIENGDPGVRDTLRTLPVSTGAPTLGITGPPGVGKSTTTSALVRALRARGRTVAVLAVDPSSPFSGGALLGDRVRMQEHAGDAGVYIRSMASRGHLGGLAATTPQVMRALEAAGFDEILVETVGVGQSEVEIAGAADTTLVLSAPGMGDGIQAAKAGILEIGDILVVNKADRDGADATARELRAMVALGEQSGEGGWTPPVVKVAATDGTGIAELLAEIDRHRSWLESSGEHRARRVRRVAEEVEALVVAEVRERVHTHEAWLAERCGAVVDGQTDAFTVAEELAARVR